MYSKLRVVVIFLLAFRQPKASGEVGVEEVLMCDNATFFIIFFYWKYFLHVENSDIFQIKNKIPQS